MNCKPDDLAICVKIIEGNGPPAAMAAIRKLIGKIVKVKVVDAEGFWTIEEPFLVSGFADGTYYSGTVFEMADEILRPLPKLNEDEELLIEDEVTA